MSGGAFDYKQYEIGTIADTIQSVIDKNKVKIPIKEKETWDNEFYYDFDDVTIEAFKEGIKFLRIAQTYAHRIDWLLSADDGEDTFKSRLIEELNVLNNANTRGSS